MKIILVLALLVVPYIVHAQEKFLGESKSLIEGVMKDGNFSLSMADITEDKTLTFQVYTIGEKHDLLFYYNPNNLCTMVIETAPFAVLTTVVQELNSKYTKTGDNSWISKDLKYSMVLRIGEGGFNVSYKLLK